jgi:citrate synthase
MGNVGYPAALYLLLTGDLPSRSTARLFEAILVSSIDHGTTPPSTLAARTAASTGAPVNAALAAGLLSINEYHGGAIEACMATLERLAETEGRYDTREAAAEAIVAEAKETGVRIGGFGHRVHEHDPRARRLFEIAREERVLGEWIDRLRAVERALAKSAGKALPVNVDGAIAAVLEELRIEKGAANALFMIARLPGLLAHVLEERRTQPPMRRIDPTAAEYDGPTGRTEAEGSLGDSEHG